MNQTTTLNTAKKSLTKKEELALGRIVRDSIKIKEKLNNDGYRLSKEDKELLEKGEDAMSALVTQYESMAMSFAHESHAKSNTSYDKEDLKQDALLALVESVTKFDPDKGCKLGTFAYMRLKKRTSEAINKSRLVRLPEHRMGELNLINNLKLKYGAMSEEEKSIYGSELEYIYQMSDIKKEYVDMILENVQPVMSLNGQMSDTDYQYVNLIADETAVTDKVEYYDLDDRLVVLLDELSEYDKNLIAFKFGAFDSTMSYTDFMEKYNLTEEEIKLEMNKSVRKMKRLAEKKTFVC